MRRRRRRRRERSPPKAFMSMKLFLERASAERNANRERESL
jgi:hypothetical protein